jgi:hypothetical protein
MKKLSNNLKMLKHFVVVLPVAIGFLYSIGYSFYNSYMEYFNIPSGIFDIDVQRTILYGIELIFLTDNFWIYGSIYFYLISFMLLTFGCIFASKKVSYFLRLKSKIASLIRGANCNAHLVTK